MSSWKPNSWRNFDIKHQPNWPDENELQEIEKSLSNLPSLVFSGETRNLKKGLKKVNSGEAFILQVGNCSERFNDCTGPSIHNYLRIVLQMSSILSSVTHKEIINIGRIAGQYAKPRSSMFEEIDGIIMPTYKGDNVNSLKPLIRERIPNPERLLEGYYKSASTLNLIRAFMQGGYSSIENIDDWKNHHFKAEVLRLDGYDEYISNLMEKLPLEGKRNFNSGFFISHEALLLNYEELFTRIDTTYKGYYDTSAHFLWVGDRTRYIGSAHIEFIRGILNPVGIKVGPTSDSEEIVDIVRELNPKNYMDKVVLIVRYGVDEISENLHELISRIKSEGLNVIWMSDPMHGNTYNHNNIKVRNFDDIFEEFNKFVRICYNQNVIPGGIHLEMTSENVTECLGGVTKTTTSDLLENYRTSVDPRLNAAQSLELALKAGILINKNSDEYEG